MPVFSPESPTYMPTSPAYSDKSTMTPYIPTSAPVSPVHSIVYDYIPARKFLFFKNVGAHYSPRCVKREVIYQDNYPLAPSLQRKRTSKYPLREAAKKMQSPGAYWEERDCLFADFEYEDSLPWVVDPQPEDPNDLDYMEEY
jgi:hypothetical protein